MDCFTCASSLVEVVLLLVLILVPVLLVLVLVLLVVLARLLLLVVVDLINFIVIDLVQSIHHWAQSSTGLQSEFRSVIPYSYCLLTSLLALWLVCFEIHSHFCIHTRTHVHLLIPFHDHFGEIRHANRSK